ncbi:16S rRNA (guanine(527)-N(7))-methyltransferase RsmG [Primorskyibacter sp. 2E233]|uniref:16S rRNA (guanine(527)-N(7))-methyltransferase RsmG n=1 Tax=Primorskyibacter sp. 2E233 TaxID=3413431 RepID=UPI003BEF7872
MDLHTAIGVNVSRETQSRLENYLELLQVWNKKINIVSPATLREAWLRHIIDSAQVFRHAHCENGTWVDLGSGGGFPGMVIAILAAELKPQLEVVLVESDARKATFLRTVARKTMVKAIVITDRIERTKPLDAQLVSARALAPLPLLLGYVARHLSADGSAYLLKGANWESELTAAQELWNFQSTPHKSITDPNSVILEIGELKHV